MKHVLSVACAGAWLLAITASVPAQSTFGMAGVQCSQYTKAARSSDILYHQASQWLLGYISGMNAAMKVSKGTTPLANLTNDQVLKSAGDYCEAIRPAISRTRQTSGTPRYRSRPIRRPRKKTRRTTA